MTIVSMLDHANYTVRNLEKSIDWYGRVFGFEPVERGEVDGEPWAIIHAGEAILCLYEKADHTYLDRHKLGEADIQTFAHIGLRVEDRAEWEATIEREDVEVLYGGEIRYAHSSSWYIADPTGWEIEVALWDDGVDFTAHRHTLDRVER
jgi:catechol 2,3-dioxygenase-like lactoylglutathione lyase family enzyme